MKHNFVNLQHRDPATAAAAIGAGVAALSTGGQIYAAGKMNKKTRKWNEKMYGIQRQDALADWERQNLYNSPAEQIKRMKEAGLNPALMYGEGSAGGGQSMAVRNSDVKGWNPEVPNIGGMGLQMSQAAAQLGLLKAQKENIEADTKNKLGDAANKPIVGENLKADTANKIAQEVVTKYLGKEAADQYNLIAVPNRELEGRAKTDEYSATSAIGQNLWSLFVDGKLKEKSEAEIESILVNNAKTREQRREIEKNIDLLGSKLKGQNLENMFNELDLKLQQETGVDRKGNAVMKLIGRIFQLLTPKSE